MKTRLYITGMSLVGIMAFSCCGQKPVAVEDTKTALMDFDTKGYTSGTIVQSKAEGDCEWTIKLQDGRHLDPMTIDKDFMQNGATVWFKYTPQRRMSRCDKASPVGITEMKMNK
ncbi:hypothetical protein [Dokdonia sp. PRO95]|uniref:hypothetical protein n=1 Tax=Dokdonia sp. PRO95 TaxID=1239415 RepID=UPI000550D2DB|nr:hypothetical protein [Dokdonia sp. PRO95]